MAIFLTAFFISYLIHGTGITIGYHRLISHRAFKSNKAVEYFFVLAGYLAFQGSPAWWAVIHRVHHKNADTEHDPHSPVNGYFRSYIGWIATDYTYSVNEICPDLMSDKLYAFLDTIDNLAIPINLMFRVLLWYFFGWQVALANFLACLIVFQIPMFLNLFCHIPELGYKNFPSKDRAVNVWWVALLAIGEGWHNNHHVHPGSARMGMTKWELDISWLMIQGLAKLGLVSRVNDGKFAVEQISVLDEEKVLEKVR